MKKNVFFGILLVGGLTLSTGCASHQRLKCRIATFDGRHVHNTPWHHGEADCLVGLSMLPEQQSRNHEQLHFIVRGSKKAREEFERKAFGPEPKPSEQTIQFKKTELEVRNRG